jgi:hypothetical protein
MRVKAATRFEDEGQAMQLMIEGELDPVANSNFLPDCLRFKDSQGQTWYVLNNIQNFYTHEDYEQAVAINSGEPCGEDNSSQGH